MAKKSANYDLEDMNNELNAIVKKRGMTYKQIAPFFGMSTYQLYRRRKGIVIDNKFAKTIERSFNEIFEKYYLAVVLKKKHDNYFWVELKTYRSFRGANRKLGSYELFFKVKDSIISASPDEIRDTLMKWLNEYSISNQEQVSSWIYMRLPGEEEDEEQ